MSGAGLSVEPPSGLPLGDSLTRSLLNTFLTPPARELLEQIHGRSRELGFAEADLPRLEAVVEAVIEEAHDALAGALSHLADVLPNRHHHWCATAQAAGARNVTLNLDLGIENALVALLPASPSEADAVRDRLLHLHGRVDRLLESGLRLSNVAVGLDPESVERLDLWLEEARTVLFVGYSARDYFDVNPYFESLAADLGGTTVVWLQFSDQPALTSVDPTTVDGSAFLRRLQSQGADVHAVTGRLEQLLEAVDGSLYGAGPSDVMRPAGARRIAAQPSAAQRLRASVRLGQAMGCPTVTLSAIEAWASSTDDPWIVEHAAQAFFDSGQFETARAMFEDLQRQFPDRDDLATKIADCLWAVGRNRKAFEMLEHALRAREPAPEVALRMRFLQLHALRRARNEVVGRVWATTEKCHRVFSETVELAGGSDTAGSDVPHLHRVRPHVMNELYVLSKDLPVEPAAVGRYERTEAEVRSGYREAASLGGVANASYRDLHERYARGDLDSRERDRLVEFADSIGNQNVAYRASLLAESLPSVLEALSDTGRVQYPLSYALKTAAQAVIRWLQFRRNSPTSRS